MESKMEIVTPKTYFLLPLKDLVIYPSSVTGVLVGREKTVNCLNKIYSESGVIFAVTQRKESDEKINKDTLFSVGTICRVVQQSNTTNDLQKRIVIEGVKKGKIIEINEDEKYYTAVVEEIEEKNSVELVASLEIENLKKVAIQKFKAYFEGIGKNIDFFLNLDIFKNVYEICFYAMSVIPNITVTKKQEILEANNDIDRLIKFIKIIDLELSILRIDRQISSKVDKTISKAQRKIYLNEKMKVIRKELGDDEEEDETGEIGRLRKKMRARGLPEEVSTKIKEELKKMEHMPSYFSEYNLLKNYVDFLIDLPWNKNTKVDTDLKRVKEILDRDHFGLEKIKDRILEFVAVYHRKDKLPGQIICFVGPPGVGKTSLAKSIAESLKRKYIKISLGGIRDEAEIRGHRKTYIGSMPGKIITSLKKVDSSNPLILLDEIDKMGSDNRGDPASALLEVLDPEQNKKFNDNFLEIDFDLSDCMFICTANDVSGIPIPLRDRMEVIRIAGYTEDEKLNIARKYLIPKELEVHGVKEEEFSIDNKALKQIIRRYTFEAGVRNLEREIAKLIRKSLTKIITNIETKNVKITEKNLSTFLGVEKFNYNKVNKEDKIGVAVGLAYTDFGGDLLNIETLKFDGSGKLTTTGKLGEVMKESAQAAFSYVRSIANNFNINAKDFNKYDFHLHVPEGATPKDGPSAGVAITASILSAMTGKKINKDVAMTGEISLTGEVMPIGGLKEKLLAAMRGQINTVVIPKDNEKNLEDIPDNVKRNLKIIPVDNLQDALKIIVKDYQ
jgi:ATP-dependent Lon protease